MNRNHAINTRSASGGWAWRRRFLSLVGATLLALALMMPAASVQPGGAGATALASAGDPVIYAAGDIACNPSDSGFKGGNGTAKRCHEKWTAAELVGATAVLPLGDEQYQCGMLSDFQQSYDPSWGQQKAIEHPVIGNHEYYHGCAGALPGAPGYFTYFGNAATPLQPGCTAKCKGYYSYNVGSWHFIALNSECGQVGGCGANSAQGKWLRADLAASSAACTIAYWHRPLYTSGGSLGDAAMQPFWQILYNAHVDIVLNGHDHIYERFAPQNANGGAASNGIREFIVGTGGENHGGINSVAANSVVRDTTTFGVLKLTLHSGSYDWSFIPDGKSGNFTDSGSASCI